MVSKITHEEAIKELEDVSDYYGIDLEDWIIYKYLIKIEKLLGFYKYLSENANDYDLHIDEVDEVHDKIYELEEELEL